MNDLSHTMWISDIGRHANLIFFFLNFEIPSVYEIEEKRPELIILVIVQENCIRRSNGILSSPK